MRQLFRCCLLATSVLLAPSAFADIVIGHVLPLSGPDAAVGRDMSMGAKIYIDEVNAANTVPGQKIVYVASDDAGQPAQTVSIVRDLIIKDNMLGLLAGSDPASRQALAQSGLLEKYSVPVVGTRNGAPDPAEMARGRERGLVELAPPAGYTPALVTEFRQALARHGAPGAQPSSAALQGYMSAKVMLGALHLLGDEAERPEFYSLMRNMVPRLSNYLLRRGDESLWADRDQSSTTAGR